MIKYKFRRYRHVPLFLIMGGETGLTLTNWHEKIFANLQNLNPWSGLRAAIQSLKKKTIRQSLTPYFIGGGGGGGARRTYYFYDNCNLCNLFSSPWLFTYSTKKLGSLYLRYKNVCFWYSKRGEGSLNLNC